MSDFQAEIYSSIERIRREDWDALWPDPVESYNFYRSLEQASIQNFQLFYLVIFLKNKMVLIAPMFVGDLNLGIAVEGFFYKIIQEIQKVFSRFLIVKTIYVGSPISDKSELGIDAEFRTDSSLLEYLDKKLTEFTKQVNARIVLFKDFVDDDMRYLWALLPLGYSRVESFPLALIEVDFKTIDEYLARLSYQTRKDFRRKMKKVKSLGGLTITSVNQIDEYAQEIFQLYSNVWTRSNIHFEELTKEFFVNSGRYMPQETIFFLYWVNGKLVGFNQCLIRKDCLTDRYVGWDEEFLRQYNLFYTSFFYNIQWCLDNKKRYYNFGQGEYDKKSRFAPKLVARLALIKHVSPFINVVLKVFIKFLESKTVENAQGKP